MASVKLSKFLGEAPKISSELLPDGVAQKAFNVKLYSGDLLPYRDSKVVDNTERLNSTVKTLHALTNPSTSALEWLSWTTDVDVAFASSSEDNEQRFYYSGDGVPKVSNYTLATTGSEPYPVTNGYYELGLPLPDVAPTNTATSFSVVSATHYERDSGNTATFYASGNHNLTSGNIVTIRDFESSDEAKAFSATNVEITVINATDFQYFSPGAQVSKTSNTTGRSDLAGNTQIRTYIYTWMTPWGEESIPSVPSNETYLKEGQTSTVGSLPTSGPSGQNFIRGLRVYRSVVSASATDYFRLATLWYPTATAKVKRVSNVSTVTLAYPHNFIKGDRFKISGLTGQSSFNITGGIVTSLVDEYAFTYAQSTTNVGETADTSGTLFHDVSESISNTARYWGESNYNFTDDFSISGLSFIVPSEDYDPPPVTMQGLKTSYNNILVGFFDNQLCFSFPDKPHAWPEKYRMTFESDIVSVQPHSGAIIVLTKEYPYIVSGNDPATMASSRINTLYPCLSKRSVVNMGYGIVWATHGGLATYATNTNIDLITKFVHDWDTWSEGLDVSTLVGHYYNGKYFGSHSAGSFIFENDDKVGGFFVTIAETFSAAFNNLITGAMFYTGNSAGDILEWDATTEVFSTLEWKSKTITTAEYVNLGAARVIADYETPSAETTNVTNYNNSVPASNSAIWAKSAQLGPVNGPTDYVDNGTRVSNIGTLNAFPLALDVQTSNLKEITGLLPVTFTLFANKVSVFQTTVSSSDIFRLPTGYRSDTFEVSVSSSARIRAIHMGETPYGLRAV